MDRSGSTPEKFRLDANSDPKPDLTEFWSGKKTEPNSHHRSEWKNQNKQLEKNGTLPGLQFDRGNSRTKDSAGDVEKNRAFIESFFGKSNQARNQDFIDRFFGKPGIKNPSEPKTGLEKRDSKERPRHSENRDLPATSAKQGQEREYFVSSTKGSDRGDGSRNAPWRRIQTAAERAKPGSVVNVEKGIYRETVDIKVSGNSVDGPIKFRSVGGGPAVIDLSASTCNVDADAAISIRNGSHLTIEGFEIKNFKSDSFKCAPHGIKITGASHDIKLSGNEIHDIAGVRSNKGNAHGIAVFGDSARAASRISIENNHLHDLKLGTSEALVVSGNVDGFLIKGNRLNDLDNIAIDIIGYEGISKDGLDRARNGRIENNRIERVDSRGNPGYGQMRSAGGIYVDGGTNIYISGNRIEQANIGIELASEHGGRDSNGKIRTTDHVTVKNNLIKSSHVAGISIGGYNLNRGAATDNVITGNTLVNNDTMQDGSGELMIQANVRNNEITGNKFYANGQNLFISNPYKTSSGNLVDNNIYISRGGQGEFQWNSKFYSSFSSYRNATGNDTRSKFQ
ncbi:MAG: right-handed parallel beta-helix repeat-containing protein [Cyanobacteriota/Melainabacteria group bacterium]